MVNFATSPWRSWSSSAEHQGTQASRLQVETPLNLQADACLIFYRLCYSVAMKRRGFAARILTLRKGAIIVGLAVVGVGFFGLQTSWASDNNNFPELAIAGTWDLGNKTPGDNLFQTYARNGGADGDSNGNFTHVLKNETSSQVRNTLVRAYFTSPPTGPITVDVAQLENACNFTGPANQVISMTIGGAAASKGGSVGPAYAGKAYADTMQVTKQVYQFYKYDGKTNNRTYRGAWDTYLYGQSNPFVETCETSQDVIDVIRLNELNGDRKGNGTPDDNSDDFWEGADTDNDGWGDGTGTIRGTCSEAAGGNDLGQYCIAGSQPDDIRNAVYNNKFEGKFTADPSDDQIKEIVRGKVWAVDVNVNLSGSDHTGTQNQVRFKLSVDGSWRMGFPDFNQVANPAQSFGVTSRAGFNDTTRGIRTMIPFGLPCNNAQPFVERNLAIYDVDKNEFGNTYVSVFARDPDTLQVTRLGVIDSADNAVPGGITTYNDKLEFNSSQMRLQATEFAQNKSIATFKLRMHKGIQYMFVLVNPNQVPGSGGPPRNPMNNLLSLNIPESIYGTVNCNYTLRPSVTPITPTFSYDAAFRVDGAIGVTGDDTEGHSWQLTKLEYGSSDPVRAAQTNGDDPCTFRPSGCQVLDSGSVPNGFAGNFSAAPYNFSQANVPLGTRICFMMSVSKPTLRSLASEWSHSELQCSQAVTTPKVQVHGDDLKVTGLINTSLGRIGNQTYGSWGEYGVLSNGINISMGSGNGLLGGVVSGSNQTDWNRLTFASGPSQFGTYGNFGGVTVPVPLVKRDGESLRPDLATLGSLAGLERKEIYRIPGTLRITGNLDYGSFPQANDIAEIPRIILVADDVIIDPGVTRIDPWIVAIGSGSNPGKISTCSTVNNGWRMDTAGLFGAQSGAGGICTQQLRFNGPVMASKIFLYRTFDDRNGEPAEIFNLRADAYLSALSSDDGTLKPVATTDFVTELPPRF